MSATPARNEPPVTLRRLLPQPAELTADELAATLDFAALAPPARPYVAVNMVATVDGRATVSGRTAPISSTADRQVFHALRTRVDAVMVGAGTVRTERYGRLVRDPARREQRHAAGLDPDPLAIVVSGRLDIPPDVPLLQDPAQRVVFVTASDAVIEGCAASVAYLRSPAVDLPAALARLRAEHGVRSILCEGGPTLNGSLLAEDLIDELFLTTFATVAGGAGALTIVEGGAVAGPRALELVWLLACGSELFARYARAR
ncbi:MAG TPA: dihydrofolate reductase family protein [Solirubrobacteraceae bacterium]|jgi:5-amino-6-(5-phosphoribosylamino)uracil reductase|nr:dihydrofolate reductase family protein [Solirubrobacteraceae bacterium]